MMLLICRIYAAKFKALKNGGSDVNVKIFFVAAAIAGGVGSANADVYRCTGADGKTVYQQSPCTSGSQKAVDDSNARAKQRAEIERREAEARDAEMEAKRDVEVGRKMEQLRACLREKSCSSYTYVSLLEGQNVGFVNETLGKPESVQMVGGRSTDYFTVPTSDGRKRARLQVVYKGLVIDRVNAY